ncbi:MAG: 6,7-dimethyl-8-ribityllumazine synthase [Phycisphaerales bacterium]|nr:6,7-dimethyl-8-ribityllumazine synthase [Phycisphaerales bacterium]
MRSPEPERPRESGGNTARAMRIGVVTSRYHREICDALENGAVSTFSARGGCADALVMASAPGSFELVAVALALAQRTDIDAVVALGCVLTGETSHDRHICDAVAHGLVGVTLKTDKPVAFGVLTCVTIEQAQARAGGRKGNKGTEAMEAAIDAVASIRGVSHDAPLNAGGSP